MKTGQGLAEYAIAQLGRPYWWGTFGQTTRRRSSAAPTEKMKITFLCLTVSLRVLLFSGVPAEWQSIVDSPNSACILESEPGYLIIADHSTQEFATLPDIQIGDRAFIKYEDATAVYKCIDIQPGYNDGHVRYANGTSAEAVYNLMCYTCTEYGVIIVGFERVEVRRSDKCPKLLPA